MSQTQRVIQISERKNEVKAERLIEQFQPPPRFATTRFANYQPNPAFPSQAQARATLEQLSQQAKVSPRGFALFKRPTQPSPSHYLDGGFGVGKTHLLAAIWHEYPSHHHQKRFLSFSELTFTIGALGMEKAIQAFAQTKLLCIDEFELDDVGNTLVVSRFLTELMPKGTQVIATSNTLPNQLGEGRFNAEDFKREIQSIANRFQAHRIDGPDYRHREGLSAPTPPEATALEQAFQDFPGIKAIEGFAELRTHLASTHPIRFSNMLDGIQAIFVRQLAPIEKQDDALRFVHFIDKLYDREIKFSASGCNLEQLFPNTYRHGAYAKKYARCLSRLTELLRESV